MSTPPASITVRDFLTDRHGFTLPSTHHYLTSYDATLAHTSRSLFRHPKAFDVHFHKSVNENDCGDVIRGEEWDAVVRGEGMREGSGHAKTIWAHFVRREGVDLFGEPLEEREERGQEREKTGRLKEGGVARLVGRRKRKKGMREVVGWEGYSLAPPNVGRWEYFSRYTEIVPYGGGDEAATTTTETRIAPPFPGFEYSVADSATMRTIQGDKPQRTASESPLFEPEAEVKRELSPEIFLDDGGVEWNDEGCC